jgi:hypothetical protein
MRARGTVVAVLVAAGATGAVAVSAGCSLASLGGGSGRPATIVARATTPDGRAAAADALAATKKTLADRLTSVGASGVTIQVDGGVFTIGIKHAPADDVLQGALRPGRLAFRRVLMMTPGPPRPVGPLSGGAAAPGPATPTVSRADVLRQVQAQLGDAWTAGQAVTTELANAGGSPDQLGPAALASVAAFGQLSGRQVDALPQQMQYLLPTVTCRQLDARPPEALSADDDQQVVACDSPGAGTTKYLLDVAKVRGGDVARATASHDAQAGWIVDIAFTGDGGPKWTALTREVLEGGTVPTAAGPAAGSSSVGIVLDTVVVAAPQIESVITGDAQIVGGDFNQESTDLLAGQIAHGALPVVLTIASIKR